MDEVVRKARLSYQQFRNKSEVSISSQRKDKNKIRINARRQKVSHLNKFGKDH